MRILKHHIRKWLCRWFHKDKTYTIYKAYNYCLEETCQTCGRVVNKTGKLIVRF